jgi:hypothetical protein
MVRSKVWPGPRRLKINKLADFELVLGHSEEPSSLVHTLFDFKPVLGHNESALLFRLVAEHVAELTRSFGISFQQSRTLR